MRNNNHLKTMSTSELWAAFRDSLSVTVMGIRRAAELAQELENRGEDLSKYKIGILSLLPLVASGAVLPELLVNYAHTPEIVEAAAKLVPEEQRKIAEPGARLPVAVRKQDGSVDTVQRRVGDMPIKEVARVFEGGRIRTPAEQAKTLPAYSARAARPVSVGVTEHTRAAPNDGPIVTVDVRMERSQYDALRVKAKAAGMTPGEYILYRLENGRIVPKSTAPDATDAKASA